MADSGGDAGGAALFCPFKALVGYCRGSSDHLISSFVFFVLFRHHNFMLFCRLTFNFPPFLCILVLGMIFFLG